MLWLTTFGLGIYALADWVAPRGAVYWIPVFGLAFFCITIQAAKTIKLGVNFVALREVKFVIGILMVGFVPLIFNENLQPRYVVGDAGFVAFLALSVVALSPRQAWRLNSVQVASFIYVLLFCSLVAPIAARLDLIPSLARDNFRFDAPSVLLLAIGASFFLFGTTRDGKYRRSQRTSKFILLASVLVALTYLSGWRIYLIRDASILLASLYLVFRNKLFLFLFIFTVALLIVSYGGFILELLLQTRFSSFVYLELDQSSLGRVLEVMDVTREFANNGNVFNYIFGFGHGATFESYYTIADRNIVRSSGRIHHVHIGPVMLYFRYGLFGLAFYFYLWVVCVGAFISLKKYLGIEYFNPFYSSIVLAGFGTLITSLAINIFNNPTQIIVIALLIGNVGLNAKSQFARFYRTC